MTPDEEIREFNEKFIKSQVSLPPEAEKVFFENLFDMYEESDTNENH
jgi:hypothetical protein